MLEYPGLSYSQTANMAEMVLLILQVSLIIHENKDLLTFHFSAFSQKWPVK